MSKRTKPVSLVDVQGVPIKVGSRVMLMTGDERGTVGWVHRISTDSSMPERPIYFADHPITDPPFDPTKNDNWTHLSWCKPRELAVIP